MTMIMDINGSESLYVDGTAAKFFSPKTLSYHGCTASTSDSLRQIKTDDHTSGYHEQNSPPASRPLTLFPGTFDMTHENDRRQSTDSNAANKIGSHRFCSVPGPTSCVFLKMALKRLHAKEDFDVLESLGEGFFGDVYKVRHRTTGEVMVLKVGKEREQENRMRVKASVLKEVDMLSQLTSHPNLLAFRGVCVDSTDNSWNLHILMDYCDAGSLSRLICNRQKCFPWYLRCSLARDISYAMDFVHSKNIMHRDLTSMNVLLQTVANGGLKAVVADFGLSCKIPRALEKLVQVGTPYWMAPECLKEDFYDEKADVFSFGIILCQMIARIDADPEAGLYRTHNFGLDYVRFTAHCPTDTPLDFLKLAFQCCLMDPTARPSFGTIYDFFINFSHSEQKDCDESAMMLTENDGRLNRSLSDATLRSSLSKESDLLPYVPTQKMKNIQSQSERKSLIPVPLVVLHEGVSYEDLNCANKDEEMKRKSRMEELARSVAFDEISNEAALDSGNPFMAHEIYKTARKLAFPGLDDRRKRVVSEVKDSGCGNRSTITVGIDLLNSCAVHSELNREQIASTKLSSYPRTNSKNIFRRSTSLPGASSDFLKVSLLRNYAPFNPLLPSSSSAGLATTVNVQRSKADFGEQCALKNKMSMAFKNEDQKFASRRYPSRRYTVMNGTLLSGGSMQEGCSKDFLSVGSRVLNRDIGELTYEHWESSGGVSKCLRQPDNVVLQQPLPTKIFADKCSKKTLEAQMASHSTGLANDCFINGVKNLRKSISRRNYAQVKRDTVLLSSDSISTTDDTGTVDPFCISGRKCSLNRRQRVDTKGSTQQYPTATGFCTIF